MVKHETLLCFLLKVFWPEIENKLKSLVNSSEKDYIKENKRRGKVSNMFFKKRDRSLKEEVIYLGLIFSVIILVVFGVLFSARIFQLSTEKAERSLMDNNLRLKTFVQGYFNEIMNTVEALASNQDIRNALTAEQETINRVLAIYDHFYQNNDHIAYIYSGYENGMLVINDYTPPEGFDATERPWYSAALEQKPYISTGLPYREINTGEWLVSQSKVLIDDEGNPAGVIAIDCCIDSIINLMGENHIFDSQRSYIIDGQGSIIVHPEEELIGEDISAITKGFSGEQGKIEYTFDDQGIWAFAHTIENPDWTILTAVNRGEILQPIIMQISFYALIILILSLLLGGLLGKIFGQRFADPLSLLGGKIAAITEGKPIRESSYRHSNAEIAEMARNIEQLTEESIKRRENELRTIIESTQEGILVVNTNQEVIYINSAFKEMWGLSNEILDTGDSNNIISSISHQLDEPRAFMEKAQELNDSAREGSETIILKDGRIFERYTCPLFNQEQVVGRLWSFRNVTDYKEIENQLRESQAYTRSILGIIPDIIILYNREGEYLDILSSSEDKLFLPKENLKGKKLIDALPPREGKILTDHIQKTLTSGEMQTIEYSLPTPAGKRWFEARSVPFKEDEVVSLKIDITDQKETKDKLHQMAITDVLTGLYNRRHFMETARKEIERAERYGHSLSAMILDIDRFKKINDSYGHAAGDKVLKELASLIVENVRKVDLVGRMGGEEFGILLPDTDLKKAIMMAERLRKNIESSSFNYGDQELAVTVSIGLTTHKRGGMNIDELLKIADKALYEAKAKGRNRVVHKEGY